MVYVYPHTNFDRSGDEGGGVSALNLTNSYGHRESGPHGDEWSEHKFIFLICFLVNNYRLLNVYRKIFGTSSYGEDARACECISAI